MPAPIAEPFPLEIAYDVKAWQRYFGQARLRKMTLVDELQEVISEPTGPKGCMTTGRKTQTQGYVQWAFSGKRSAHVLQHRMVWAIVNDRWPSVEHDLLHSCDNRVCCNPLHLKPGTTKQNVDDMIAKGRKRHGARLTFERITEIRDMRLAGYSVHVVAAALGADNGTVSRYAPGRLA